MDVEAAREREEQARRARDAAWEHYDNIRRRPPVEQARAAREKFERLNIDHLAAIQVRRLAEERAHEERWERLR